MKRNAGFTLIELLVVMAIMAVLLGLLLPAVQRVRETASRASCANNLKQLGLALYGYHAAHGSFPPGVATTMGDNLEDSGHGAYFFLLPFLEQDNWFRQWDEKLAWYEGTNAGLVTTQLKIFFCPSNRTSGNIDLQFLVPFAGRDLPDPASCDYLMCKGANAALCRVTQIPLEARGVFDVNSRTRLTDVRDGTSNTFAIGEGAGNHPRFGIRRYYLDTEPAQDFFPGQPVLIDQSWSAGPMATQKLNSHGFIFGSTLGITALRAPFTPPFDEPMNTPLALPSLDNNCGCTNSGTEPGKYDTIGGFRSAHSGGCNFLFCDGGVRFVRETLSDETYRALSTMAGGDLIVFD
jgi:prepilin-type N-terminal cleavage/methylation domain-containing protein/prepilin-type processing-associated H-X9-DG protein